jgi:hypothetical protein
MVRSTMRHEAKAIRKLVARLSGIVHPVEWEVSPVQ